MSIWRWHGVSELTTTDPTRKQGFWRSAGFFIGLRHLDVRDRVCLLVLGCLAGAFFAPHLTGQRLFIGNPDRINTFLNIRKYSVDSLREFGRISTWNDKMFAGYDTSGLHWMLPELDPFGYLGALLPEAWLFWYSGWISCLFLFLGGGAFFALSRTYVENRLAALVAASTYVLSSFAVTRLGQVDWAFALLILTPLAILVLRRADRQPLTRSFGQLTLLVAAMATLTFLQEVAYVFILLVMYTGHRVVLTGRWRTAVVCFCAMLVGVALAAPRIYTVYESFMQFDRGTMETSVSAAEILRWFNDGIFGRSPSEVAAASNTVNLAEGLQIYSSTFVTLFVLSGIARWRRGRLPGAAMLFLALFGWIIGQQASTWIVIGGLGSVLLLGRLRGWATSRTERDASEPDEVFCLLLLGLALSVVLLDDVRFVLDQASFGVDFTHSRIVVATLVPLNILLALYLSDLWDRRPQILLDAAPDWHTRLLIPVVAAATLMGALVLSESCLGTWFAPGQVGLRLADGQGLVASEIIGTLLAAGLFVALLVAMALVPRARHHLAATLAILMVLHAFHDAYQQVWGVSTQTYPDAFRGQNNFAAPAGALQPPDTGVRDALRRRLENHEYRTAILVPRTEFSGFPQPHLAEFYGLRLLGGYSAGVPIGLARLPWPAGVREPRTLSFSTPDVIDWPLLAYTNVKYVTVLDVPLYYNVRSADGIPVPGLDVDRVRVLVNPLSVVPRHFFAARVQAPSLEADKAEAAARSPSPELDATAVDGGDIMLTWSSFSNQDVPVFIERRDRPDAEFRELGIVPSSAEGFRNDHLDASLEYGFRIRTELPDGTTAYSRTTLLEPSRDGVDPPEALTVEWRASNEALVTWIPEDGAAMALEMARPFASFELVATSAPGAGSMRVQVPEVRSLNFRGRTVTDVGLSPHSTPVSLRRMFRQDPRVLTTSDRFVEARTFSTEGELRVDYQGDRVDVEVTSAPVARFLVLNERYDRRWKAIANGMPLEVYPSNGYMRGVEIPPGVSRIELRYVPFLHTPLSAAIWLFALGFGVLVWFALRHTNQNVLLASHSGSAESLAPIPHAIGTTLTSSPGATGRTRHVLTGVAAGALMALFLVMPLRNWQRDSEHSAQLPTPEELTAVLEVPVTVMSGPTNQFSIQAPTGSVDLSRLGETTYDIGHAVGLRLKSGHDVGFVYDPAPTRGPTAAEMSVALGYPVDLSSQGSAQFVVHAERDDVDVSSLGAIVLDLGHAVGLRLDSGWLVGLRFGPVSGPEAVGRAPTAEELSRALGVPVESAPEGGVQYVVRAPRDEVDVSGLGVLIVDVGYSMGFRLANGLEIGLRFEPGPGE